MGETAPDKTRRSDLAGDSLAGDSLATLGNAILAGGICILVYQVAAWAWGGQWPHVAIGDFLKASPHSGADDSGIHEAAARLLAIPLAVGGLVTGFALTLAGYIWSDLVFFNSLSRIDENPFDHSQRMPARSTDERPAVDLRADLHGRRRARAGSANGGPAGSRTLRGSI